jgi:hypothetical protein
MDRRILLKAAGVGFLHPAARGIGGSRISRRTS